MKSIIIGTVVISLITFSFCFANETPVEKAYSLYYKGEKEAAIDMIEDYVMENPDAKAYYFLGYAYYEMKEFAKAREYFDEAYRLKSFYSPMPEGDQ